MRFLFLSVFLVLASPFTEAGFLNTITRGLKTAQLYQRVDRKDLVEITEELLSLDSVHAEVKQAILEKGRRVFLFEYPSDGMKIKGYLSFVPKEQREHLLVYFRGGSGIYLINSPGNRTNFLGNHTIISSTYRSGPSPGCDEFGGADVVDSKHLLEYIPILEEKLQTSFTEKEKIAVGWSRGGMQMFLAFDRFPEMHAYFDRAISVSGVLDLEHFLQHNPFIKKLIRYGLFQKINQEWIDQRNPLKNCDLFPKSLPLLVLQGTDDDMIDLSVGKKMVDQLKSKGCCVDYHEMEGTGHCHHTMGSAIVDWVASSKSL